MSEILMLITFRGQPVCALPRDAPSIVRRRAAALILPMTVKRTLVRRGLMSLVKSSLDSTVGEQVAFDSLPTRLGGEKLLESLASMSSGLPSWEHVAVYWPSQLDRGRIYLHLLTSDGSQTSFVKVVAASDAEVLLREAAALKSMDGGVEGLWRAPRVQAFKEMDEGSCWLATEPLPADVSAARFRATPYPAEVVSSYQGARMSVPRADLDSLGWWKDFAVGVPPSFLADLENSLTAQVDVARVHGDLGAHNMAWSRDDLWIFDWESSAVDGPANSDYWGFRFRLDSIVGVLADVARHSAMRYGEALAAVAFQASRQVRAASQVVGGWGTLRKEVVP